MTIGYLEHLYDPGVKGQDHIYLKHVYGWLCEFLFYFLTEGVHILHDDCLSCVDYNNSL